MSREPHPSAPTLLWRYELHPLDGDAVIVTVPIAHRDAFEAHAGELLAALDRGVLRTTPAPAARHLRLA